MEIVKHMQFKAVRSCQGFAGVALQLMPRDIEKELWVITAIHEAVSSLNPG
jgi:hypothetical protein